MWSHEKRVSFESAFYRFLDCCPLNSKDYIEPIMLGPNLFWGQKYFYTKVFDGLERGVHKFFCLKSRQLGITTSIRALSVFYTGVHAGMKGALVFDTLPNRENARGELSEMISALPPKLGFPRILRENRDAMVLATKSQIQFKNAGVTKKKSSGGLGRSVGLSLAHLSEICMYDNDEGLVSFEESLSEINPNRLYIWESTARGYNIWHTKWVEAREDPDHCECIFLGWWSKDSQRIDRDDPDFEKYGSDPPTDKEAEKIAKVKELYDFQIAPEQLAWVRRKMDPAYAAQEADAVGELREDDPLRIQEQPWTEDEAFQQSGATFFTPKVLKNQQDAFVSNKYTRYMFHAGAEFDDLRIYRAPNARSTELKVWEEPHPEGVYVLGIDPAFGENEQNDRSAIQVLRCYADGVDQVAEYAWPLITTRQLAWAIAAIMAWYGQGENSSVRYCLELNGPGTAVFQELRDIKRKVQTGYFDIDPNKSGLEAVFRNVKAYIYTRPDGMGVGTNYHFKTNVGLKVMIMERMRDFASNGSLRIRSHALIDEMNMIKREGDSISAPRGKKDDRAVAMALACHCWEERDMKSLVSSKRTRQAELARLSTTMLSQVQLFNTNLLSEFFKQKQQQRTQDEMLVQRRSWGSASSRR